MTMPDYRDAIKKVLEHEGGYIFHEADRGSHTNFGVTIGTYNQYMTAKTGKPYSATVDEIKNMSPTVAIDIYKKLYWDKIQGDKIRKYTVALAIFDQAINRGVSSAVKQAQRVVKKLDPMGFAKITEDGVMGPNTLAALNSIAEKPFIDNYLSESKLFYQNIVQRNPSQSVFLTGWLNRITSLSNELTKKIGSINSTTVGIGIGVVVMVGLGSYLLWKYGMPSFNINSPGLSKQRTA
jgi:lysozyme family protein